jgi:hypothetical protein
MPRITEYGPTRPHLSTGSLGYNPGIIVGEVPATPDPAETSTWYIPYENPADPGLVQWKRGSRSGGVVTTTLDAAPTAGNMLVAYIPMRESIGITVSLSGTGWTLIETGFTGDEAGNWPHFVYERTVQPGDGAVWTATRSAGASDIGMWLIELEGVTAVDASDESSDVTTAPTLSLTPVTADPIIILSFVSVRSNGDETFTPATSMTEIVDDYLDDLGGTNGPQIAINWRVVSSPTGSYTVGSTYGGSDQRAVIAASFVGASGDVIYLPAFAVNDDDDATFDYVDVSIAEFLRATLSAAIVLSGITLRVGLENSGSTTIEVFGANEADFSDEVSLDSTTFSATGSYTAQDVAFTLPGTTGYLYLRFELGSAQGIRVYEVDFDPLATGVTDHGALDGLADNDHPQYALDTDFDAHLADTTDAHDASAISVLDTAAVFTATNVETALKELYDSISGGGIPATIVDAKGDLIVATAADTVARKAAGANDTILMADSSTGDGLKWVASQTPSTLDYDDTAAEGTADTYARGDHVHGMPSAGAGGADDPIADIFGAADTAYEFDTSSLAGLTAIGTPDVEDADTSVPGHLFYRDDTSGTAWMGRYQASPSTPFTAITKISGHNFRSNFNGGGLIVGVANPATGAFTTCIVGHNSTRIFNAEKFTNRTTFSSTLGGGGYADPGVPTYLAVVVNSTTDIDYLWSLDGRVWRKFVDANNPSLTVASIGIAMKSENSGGASVAFDFFRIWNSALTFPGAP